MVKERIQELNTCIQEMFDDTESDKEAKLFKEIKDNPKAFYKYANEKKKGKSVIGPLKTGDKFDSDPKRMAELLSTQYESVFSKPAEDLSHHLGKRSVESRLDFIRVTVADILSAIKAMKNGSSPGPDGIPVSFYKDYAEELAPSIAAIWRYSMLRGKQVEEPIFAIITPLHKGGPKCYAKNYRPVALTDHFYKIFERVLRSEIVKYLEENDLMNVTQHGFRSGRSTTTQLLEYFDSVLGMLEEGHYVDSIYLDFAKAFDKVDHEILLIKMAKLGIRGHVLTWMSSFLKCRQQAVRVGGKLSSKVWVKSGVPQGSVLGPLLFLIMMHDTNEQIDQATLSSYADDTKLWQKITCLNDNIILQEELVKLYEWARLNNMDFNGDKFEGLSFGKDEEQAYIAPNGLPIVQNKVVKDLGVHIEENLKFTQHIKNIVAKGKRMDGWIRRTIKSRRKEDMKVLLKSLVQSQVEYCCVLWSPKDQATINMIESVQAQFTQRISEYQEFSEELGMPVCSVSYQDRLKDLKIYSLERRRERMQILYINKVILGLIPNPGLEIQYCPRNKYRVVPKQNRHQSGWIRQARDASLFVQGPLLYNSLPSALRELEDLEKSKLENVASFKQKLDKHLEGIPDVPGTANSILYHNGINYGL